jgi:hypothetical protein
LADKRRFEAFARFITERFGEAKRVFDIAGGQGRLNEELGRLGREATTFDQRHKHLDVPYAQRRFTLEEPCACDVVVGMHPDGATRIIVEYAATHRVPFAIVPCCSDNGMSYKPWMRHLAELAAAHGMQVEHHTLPIEGRAAVIVGFPSA